MTCFICKKDIEKNKIAYDESKNTYCYTCASKRDLNETLKRGKGHLYDENGYLTDWPGLLKVKATFTSTGKHNIAGTRKNFWFRMPDDKFVWYGVRYGDNTQIVHIKRTKKETF